MAANDLRLQVILQALDRATAPLRAIERSSKGAATALKTARDRVAELNAQQRAIDGMRQQQAALAETTNKLKVLRAQLDSMRTAGTASTRQIAAQERAVAKQTAAYEAQRRAVVELRTRMNSLGIGNVAQAQARLASETERANTAIAQQTAKLQALAARQRQLDAIAARRDQAQTRAGQIAAAGVGATAAGAATLTPIAQAVREYSRFEDAMLGIARQVNGARSPTGELTAIYWDMARQIHQLGREIPLATTEIADMVTAGARMEVPTEQLAEYTRLAAQLAIAFDAVPAEISEQMGKVAKNFQIPITGIRGLADAINYLDDNAISKGNEIIDVLNRISGVVSTVAMSSKDAAALASTLLTLGERPEAAATAINAITQKLAAATKGTKKFQEAVSEIGLNSGAIQSGMAKDATGTLLSVVEAIRKLPESKRVGVMVELVGMEHSDTLAKLVTKPEELRRQMQLANGMEAAGSMAREFAARVDTLSARWQMANNRMFEASSTLGRSLRPALVSVMDTASAVLERVSAWTNAHPELTAAILKTGAVIGVLLVVVGGLLLAVASVLGPLALLRYSWAMLGLQGPILMGVIQGIGSAMLVLGRAMLANPIMLAVAALAAGAWLLYSNWDRVGTLFTTLPARFAAAGREIVQGLANGITNSIAAVREAVGGVADAALGWFKAKLGIKSPSRVFMAAGGDVAAGAAIGIDRGREDVRRAALGLADAAGEGVPSAGAGAGRARTQRTAPLTTGYRSGAGAAAAAGGPHQINIYPLPGMDPQAIARAVSAELDRRDAAARSRRRSTLTDPTDY